MIKALWVFPLSIYALDASAWGLFTHIYFAQYITLLVPVLDPRFRKAVIKFPELVHAGACLPDLSLIAKSFNTTHQWSKSQTMLDIASTDEELALAIGYNSHLFVDVLAHNHFVPAFEAKWQHHSIVTHIVAEWAMDAHIKKDIEHRPYTLLKRHANTIAPLISKTFDTDHQTALGSIKKLAYADKALRFSKLASILLRVIKRTDDEFERKLNYYIHKTQEAITEFEASLKGKKPKLGAELMAMSATDMHQWRQKCLVDARFHMQKPIDFDLAHHEHTKTENIRNI